MEITITVDGETYTITLREKEALSQDDDWTGYTYEVYGGGIDVQGIGSGLSYGDALVDAVQRLSEELGLDK